MLSSSQVILWIRKGIFLIIISFLSIFFLDVKDNDAWAGDDEPYALKFLPHDQKGAVDWVTAVSEGLIKPVDSLDPNVPENAPLQLDILIKSRSDKGVVFSHERHTYWFDCDGCHPSIFTEKKDGNGITMQKIMKGEQCGFCHATVAFSIYNCENCHKEEKDITKKWKK